MAHDKTTGTYLHLVHDPKGGVEGFLVQADGETIQFVLDKHDDASGALVATLKSGQAVVVAGEALPPSPKGRGAHPVRAFRKLVSIDGQRPSKVDAAATGYAGKIVRFNYARHGAPNGYVLDSGDFIHVKPDGFTKLGLKVGDAVRAQGDAHFLATGGGWAVEAERVNGKSPR